MPHWPLRRDEGRSPAYDAEEPHWPTEAADAAVGRSLEGRGVSGGLLILVTEREPCEGGRPFAAARLIWQLRQSIPKRLRRNCEYLCRGSLAIQRPRWRSTSTLPTAASTTPSNASALHWYPSNNVDSSIATTGVATLVYDDGPAPTCFSSVR